MRVYWNTVTNVFYGVSGPSTAKDFILAMLQNLGFHAVLGLKGGVREGQFGI